MYRLVWIRALLILCGVFASAPASAFAIFAVPFGTPFTPGANIGFGFGIAIPSQFGQGTPLTWKKTSVRVSLAFTPDPPAALSNGTTTWNQNAQSAISEWNAVGANFSFSGSTGGGNPCITNGTVVAAFHPTICLGILPSLGLGISRLVGVMDAPNSMRIVDADIAIITPNTASASGAMITDAFDGPITFPDIDFRRIVLHEFGHSLGLAHPDDVFGNTPATQRTIMHSSSFTAFRLAADDKNGALALYPAAAPSGGGGGGGGGGSNAWILAIFLVIAVAAKFSYRAIFRRRCSVPMV